MAEDIYDVSWWGDVNASNGWGSIYPFDADGSYFRADTTLVFADTTIYTADQTIY
tara:strand:+ start:2108 stop:2272 length:165 start_codon:yes stop_codon:yes gene_type:complete